MPFPFFHTPPSPMKKLLYTVLLSALPFTGWAQVVQSGDWF